MSFEASPTKQPPKPFRGGSLEVSEKIDTHAGGKHNLEEVVALAIQEILKGPHPLENFEKLGTLYKESKKKGVPTKTLMAILETQERLEQTPAYILAHQESPLHQYYKDAHNLGNLIRSTTSLLQEQNDHERDYRRREEEEKRREEIKKKLDSIK